MRWRSELTPFFVVSLLISVGLLIYFEPWRAPSAGHFEVSAVSPSNGSLARNEVISLQFDRLIHAETPIEALIQVQDSQGDALPIEIERRGNQLLLRPRNPLGWPAHEVLQLSVRPGLALPFRAADHSRLRRAYQSEFTTAENYLDLGVSFRLTRRSPRALVAVRLGTDFVFQSDLPLDRQSLVGGRATATLAVLGSEREQRSLAAEVFIADDERNLIVRPWSKALDFAPNRPHRLTIHKGRLRSLTGRSLERDLVVEFRTARDAAREGQVLISFAKDDLVQPAETGLELSADFAEPALTLFSSVELGAKEEQADTDKFAIFGPEPRRLQLLIPGHHLGVEPGLITGFAFFAAADPIAPTTVLHQDLYLPRVVFRIGEAAPLTARGLSPDPSLNLQDLGMRETVVSGSREGELQLLARPRRGSYGEWIDVLFERPYTYRGGNRDLILEVVNDGGAFAMAGQELPPGWSGPRWVASASKAANPQQRPMSLYLAGQMGENPVGIPTPAIFATKIHIERYHDFVTRWYSVPLANPTWFRVPADDQIDASGVEGRDFVLDFQGQDPDGELLGWTRLDELAGCRKIRARLRFLPDADWRNGGVQVRRLRIGYRDGR